MKRFLFTWALSLVLGAASVARADRVVLLPVTGTAEEETLDAVEERIAATIVALGHEAVTDPAAMAADAPPPPETANEMRAVAEMQNSHWVVVPRMTALPGQYRLHLRVGYAAAPRVEEIEVIVLAANEEERLRDVLGALLRPEGLGDDAVRLTEPQDGETEQPPPDETDTETEEERARREEEERARLEEEERARREFEERERQRAEEEERRQQAAWEARERYGERGPWMFNVGADLRAIIAHQDITVGGADSGGGVLGGVSVRGGRLLVGGLELRAAVDFMTGASSGFAVSAGGVYLFSPFEEAPVFIGAGVEAGWFQFTRGSQVASFMVRASGVGTWRVSDDLYLEVAIPEVMLLTANGGVGTLGFSVRAGSRF